MHGLRLRFEGWCRGGEVGAALVRPPSGPPAVLTWEPGGDLARARRVAAVVADLAAAGYPAPRHLHVLAVDGAVAVVQERLAGRPIDRLTDTQLDAALALVERHRGALAGHPGVGPAALHLRGDGPGFCLHGPLRHRARHDPRTARLLGWIAEVGAGAPPTLAGEDLVHYDFHTYNMLAVGDTITGVVDWGGLARGDRRFDLVTLRFGLHPHGAGPAVLARLDRLLDETVPPDLLRAAWAHVSLRVVDWSIRHWSAATTEAWLDLAETRAR